MTRRVCASNARVNGEQAQRRYRKARYYILCLIAGAVAMEPSRLSVLALRQEPVGKNGKEENSCINR
jgi:hypothetical protein